MRYIILVLLNTPIILLAFLNLLTRYKLKSISTRRFRVQFAVWFVILLVLLGSYPVYNCLNARSFFDSQELSLFDIMQTTAIIFLLYLFNNIRQRAEMTERRLRELHQELSIKLSKRP